MLHTKCHFPKTAVFQTNNFSELMFENLNHFMFTLHTTFDKI